MSAAKFDPNGGKKMRLGKPYDINDRPTQPLENNNGSKPKLAPLRAAKRPKMNSGVNSVSNVVNNSTNATKKMTSGGKNGSTYGRGYPTWA